MWYQGESNAKDGRGYRPKLESLIMGWREAWGQGDFPVYFVQLPGIGTSSLENPAGGDPPRCYERNTFTRGPINVHAFIRDHRRCENADPVRLDLGDRSHVYDMRAKRYVGNVSSVETTVPPGDTALYACLPYRVKSLAVRVPRIAKPGEELGIEAQLDAGTGELGDHVLHMDLVEPTGEPAWHYTRNELAASGELSLNVPLAANEKPGTWTVRIRDVLTGVTGQAKISVAAP